MGDPVRSYGFGCEPASPFLNMGHLVLFGLDNVPAEILKSQFESYHEINYSFMAKDYFGHALPVYS